MVILNPQSIFTGDDMSEAIMIKPPLNEGTDNLVIIGFEMLQRTL